KEHVESTADLTTDDSTSYTKLKEHVHSHTASVIPHEDLSNVLPWVHTAISNAKRQLLGVYYKIKPEYLQYYLNQFCYKFNRRYFGENQFERLLIAAVTYAPDFKSRIYNRNYCG
ncbi:ISXO2-like transposase domain-containing protein, partial [Porphyromonadaceae bacterium NLAE-zl-C104]